MAHRRPSVRSGVLLSALLVLLAGPPVPTAARSPRPTATVVGTAAVNVRACPGLDCAVVVSAPLGARLAVTGEAAEGFLPVAYRGHVGFAYALYLAADDAPVPYLARGTPGCDRVALIFNVGVGWEPATGILDTLAAERAPATMFVMGWWARQHPDLLRRMDAAGFPIGSHGDQQTEPTALTDAAIVADLQAAAAAVEAVLGAPPGPWYTPYAAAADDRVRAVVAGLGYLPVAWDVPAADYGRNATPDSVWARVVPNVYDGAIVEFHLDGPASAASTGVALPWVISALRDAGYRLVTIPELDRPCEGDGSTQTGDGRRE